jgi:hypothetical protein
MDDRAMTRDELIVKVREVAGRLGVAALSRSRFLAEAGVRKCDLERHFDGWTELCRAAGVEPVGRKDPIPDDVLFEEMRATFLALGGVPKLAAFERRFRFTSSMFYQRGWSWPEAKARCRAWIAARDPAFPYLDQLPAEARPRRSRLRPGDPDAPARRLEKMRVHEARGNRLMGERIDFRGMARAPVNEQGVVALFAMVAQDLGYSIELMTQSFPDCEAVRRVRGNRFERVRIELEYESRNFLHHDHDPARCDVLVCWIANWQPPEGIELLELRSLIKRLPAQFGMPAPEATAQPASETAPRDVANPATGECSSKDGDAS